MAEVGKGDLTFAPEVRRALPVLLAQRLVVNTGGRMVFTFLAVISAGTGLSVTALSRILFARDLTGLLGPALGRLVRTRGSWATMTVTGALAAVGMLLTLTGPVGVAIGLVLWGACRTAFHVASFSWIGDVVAYRRRGRATGLVELTWAGAALVGLPLLGLAIDAFGWRAAPTTLALLGLPLAAWSARQDTPTGGAAPVEGAETGGRRVAPATIVALLAPTAMLAAAQFLFFAHGLWLADTYGFDAARIGFAVVAVGGAEALGSMAVFRLADRLGKRLAIGVGSLVLGAALAGFVAVPAPPLALGLGLLVLAFFGSEFAIVSSMPLVSELEADNRAAVIGLSTGMSTVARAVISLLAGWAYTATGFRTTMVLALVMLGVSIAVLVLGVREPDGEPAA